MTAAVTFSLPVVTVGDLLQRLGGVPADRMRLDPVPGTGTVADLVTLERPEGRLYELIDGILVEKAYGFRQSVVGVALGAALHTFAHARRLGVVSGAGGPFELAPGRVRLPDVAFVSWGRLPRGRIPTEHAPRLAPDLAADILKPDNTTAEMDRKRREYFDAGVRLVWLVDPDARTVAVYEGPGQPRVLGGADALDGGTVLPGFALPLRDLFAELDL